MLHAERQIEDFKRWGSERDDVRALVLTSTRTVPGDETDLFSDFDLIVVVSDIAPFYESRAWLNGFGPLLVVYRDPMREYFGLDSFAYITQYENGLKIDFTLWPVETLTRIVGGIELPEDLDVGYEVLLDKDDLTVGLKPPTYRAHIPRPPSLTEYLTNIELLFHEATYVAKHLWRDDLMPAKYCFDVLRQGSLRKMLEWRVEIDHDWDIKPGAYGKGLKRRLPSERWLDVERTYVGPDLEENWAALLHTLVFFREVAIEVGDSLGYEYPEEMDRRSRQYLATVVELDREAESFPFESRPVDAIAGPDLGPPRRHDSPHKDRDPSGTPHPNGSSRDVG